MKKLRSANWQPGATGRRRTASRPGSQRLLTPKDVQINSMLPMRSKALRAEDGSRSARSLEDLISRRALTALLVVLTLSFVFQLGAQTNRPAPGGPSNRFLLIMDTSRGMQRRAAGALQALQDLLASGMGGQLRRGDTLGVWTYNQDLNAGKFPLQRWTPETHRSVAIHILNFLKEQKYEKKASLGKVLPPMEDVIKDSQFITVILISDGNQKIHGTPYDDRINQFYNLWHSEQQAARMPFITVLRAQHGSITDHSVNSAPWPVEMPPLPAELAGPAPPEKKPAAQQPAPAPLVFSGKKSASVPPPKPADESAVPVQREPAQPATAETTEAKKTEPAPGSTEKPASEVVPGPPASPVAVEGQENPKAPAPKSDGPALAKPQDSPSEAVPATPSNAAADQPTSIIDARPSTQEASSPSVSAPRSSNSPSSWSPSTMPGPTAVGTFLSNNKIWVAAVVLAVIVFGFVILLMRGRARPTGRISLSRSADHDQK